MRCPVGHEGYLAHGIWCQECEDLYCERCANPERLCGCKDSSSFEPSRRVIAAPTATPGEWVVDVLSVQIGSSMLKAEATAVAKWLNDNLPEWLVNSLAACRKEER